MALYTKRGKKVEVTGIKKSPVSKTLKEIYIDFEYAFSLYDNNLKELGIKENVTLNEEKYKKEIFPVICKNALQDALSFIAKVNCTKKQVEDKLSLRKYPYDAIKKAMDYIGEKGFIDDYEYALSFARMSVKKGKGERYIQFELSKRGIPEDMVKEVVSLTCNDECLLPVAQKRLGMILKGREKPDYKDLNKLKEYLVRQGYGYDKISDALRLITEKYED